MKNRLEYRQMIRSFSNGEGNDKEKVTLEQTFAELWQFCDHPILFILHNDYAKTRLVCVPLDLMQGI